MCVSISQKSPFIGESAKYLSQITCTKITKTASAPGLRVLNKRIWNLFNYAVESEHFLILGHLSDTDICPTTEISFLDKRPCRTFVRKRTFVLKSVTIIFTIMLETMVYNVWVTGCSTVRCINVCLLV